ncbi:MAG: MaoC family dehydratase N-terminal domain-containing protein [Nocardioides sp.]|nr:MaoC family dehydratase N-terminal domain-containing protein [Nocardioidaceae bacterium]MCB8957841.1 MaoC family dehydratase N-terminal domain-containing protein [Nocardioides sp.]
MAQESNSPTRSELDGLAERLAAWTPPATETPARIDREPAERFAALLDADLGDQTSLPPLWLWFYFLEAWPQSNLGPDGHPVEAPFYPPLSPRARMFAGGRVQVLRDITFGEAVTRRSEVTDVDVKTGRTGELVFVTVRHRYLGADGAVALEEEQDHVYRTTPPSPGSGAAVAATAPATTGGAGAVVAPGRAVRLDRARGRLDFRPDPMQLFLFSALTHNAHRIHYDLPYAMGVEGFPGLVVHGPLLALLMLELGRRTDETPFLGSFEYRLRRPAFGGQHLVVARSSEEVTVSRHGDPTPLATSRITAKEASRA